MEELLEVWNEEQAEKSLARKDKNLLKSGTNKHRQPKLTAKQIKQLSGKVVTYSMKENMTLDEIRNLPFDEARAKLSIIYNTYTNPNVLSLLKCSTVTLGKALREYGIPNKRGGKAMLVGGSETIKEIKPVKVNSLDFFWSDTGETLGEKLSALGMLLSKERSYDVEISIKEIANGNKKG